MYFINNSETSIKNKQLKLARYQVKLEV